MRRKWAFLAPLAILAMLAFIALGGVIVEQLWNWLLPGLLGLREITFWQALGILLLCRILFGGFGLHGSGRPGMRRRLADRLADGIAEREAAMTPEERERFRQRMRERYSLGPTASEGTGPNAGNPC